MHASGRYDLGVDVDDKARRWWFVYDKGAAGGADGGRYGSGPSRDSARSGRGGRQAAADGSGHDYVRSFRDDYVLSASQLAQVDELLGLRLSAKRKRDFHRADDLQTELRNLGVEVDDKAREWYVRYHDGRRSASSFNVRD